MYSGTGVTLAGIHEDVRFQSILTAAVYQFDYRI